MKAQQKEGIPEIIISRILVLCGLTPYSSGACAARPFRHSY